MKKTTILCFSCVLLSFTGLKVNAQTVNANFTVNSASVCQNVPLEVTNTTVATYPSNIKYTWMTNTYNSSPYIWVGDDVPQGIKFYNTNTYVITLEATDTINYISSTHSVSVNVWPEASWSSVSPQYPSLECGPVLLENSSFSNIWKNSIGDTVGIGTSFLVTTPDNYTVISVNEFGCSNQSNQTISVLSGEVQIIISANDNYGNSIHNDTIKSCATSVNLFANVSWSNFSTNNGTTFWEDGSSSSNRNVTQSGMYYFTHTGLSGCSQSDTVYVILNPSPIGNITMSDSTLCQGDTTTLSSPSNYTYLWSTGETTQSIKIYYGTYCQVTLTNNYGCKYTTFISVNMNQNPDKPTIFHSTNDCQLTTNGGYSYQWYINDSLISGATGQYYTASITKFYSVKITDANGCDNISDQFWSDCDLSVGEYYISICANDNENNYSCNDTFRTCATNISLNASILWSVYSSDSGISFWENGSNSYSRIVSQTGMYYFTHTGLGGYSQSDTMYVIFDPLPEGEITISNSTLCEGDTAILYLPLGYTYLWSTGQTSQSIKIQSSGSYQATMINNLGCSHQTSLIVNAKPIPEKPEVFHSTNDCQLTTNGGYSYQWYTNGAVISGATNQYYSTTSIPKFCSVQITDGNGCKNMSDEYWSDCGLGVNEKQMIVSSVYPNPFTDVLKIVFSDNEEHTISLIDISGKKVAQTKGKETVEMQRNNIDAGMYFIEIDSQVSSKIIVK